MAGTCECIGACQVQRGASSLIDISFLTEICQQFFVKHINSFTKYVSYL